MLRHGLEYANREMRQEGVDLFAVWRIRSLVEARLNAKLTGEENHERVENLVDGSGTRLSHSCPN
jgi:hypothetical protein